MNLDDQGALFAVKIVHTVVWVFFVACILAIPALVWKGQYVRATWFVGIVLVEVLVILLNRWSCPLTPIAARYTEDRRANFDIFLPEWLARYNKVIFGGLYLCSIVYLVIKWGTQGS